MIFIRPNPNLDWNTPDLSDQLNILDDLTGEPIFTLEKSDYIEFENFIKMSQECNFDKNLTVFSLNIRSLGNKTNKLINVLSQLKFLPSVICLQEIWSVHGNVSIPGYHPLEYYSRDSDSTPNPNCGGGVGIYIRNDIDYHSVPVKNSSVKGIIESIWVRIVMADGKTKIIGSCYRPNSAPLACPQKFNASIEKLMVDIKSKYKNSDIFLAGDFNFDLLKYEEHKDTETFLTTMYDQGMIPLITKPTRLTHDTYTLIDNIFTSEIYNTIAGIVSVDLSDHEATFLIDRSSQVSSKESVTMCRSTNPKDLTLLAGKLKETDFSDVINSDIIDVAYNNFYTKVENIIDSTLPLKKLVIKPLSKNKPWYTLGMSKSNKTKIKLYRKQIAKPTDQNILAYKQFYLFT